MNKHTATLSTGEVVTRNSKTRVYAYMIEIGETRKNGEVFRKCSAWSATRENAEKEARRLANAGWTFTQVHPATVTTD